MAEIASHAEASAPAAPPPPGWLRHVWSSRIHAPHDAVWQCISDTRRVNLAAGLPRLRFSFARATPRPGGDGDAGGGSDRDGPARRRGELHYMGMRVCWDEHPFEWVHGREQSIVRTYDSGPLYEMRYRVSMRPIGPGETELVSQMDLRPRGVIGTLLARYDVPRRARRGFRRVHVTIEAFARGEVESPFATPPPRLAPHAPARLDAGRLALREAGCAPDLVERLVQHVQTACDLDVDRMRPFALADLWRADRLATLRVFLRAARAGLVDLTWDVLCPHCRGAAGRVEGLSGLSGSGECESCAIAFEVAFDRSVELTFRPSAAVRTVDGYDYCSGGPGAQRHVLVQQRLAPGEHRRIDVALPAGRYAVRSATTRCFKGLRVDDGAAAPVAAHIALSPGTLSVSAEVVRAGAPITFDLANDDAREHLVQIERTAWSDDIVTAAWISTQQEFRDLFATEVLRPGERLAISHLAFLFSDLRASTRLYEEVGDARAFALVRDHFQVLMHAITQRHGGVVKTIGDAVMAVFPDAGDAMRAALAIQEQIARFNADRAPPAPLVVKLGLHAGPCIAVNLNDRLDYFGTTVNLAARIQGQSHGGDVVVSESTLADPGARAAVGDAAARSERFTANLRGIEAPVELVRVWCGAPRSA